MAETVNLPAMGNVRKEWVYAGTALVVGIVGYAYFKRRASTTPTTDTTGQTSASTDAFQGAALPMSSYDAYGNLVASQSATGPPANWALQAVDYLANVFGYDRQTAGLAITHYLNGATLTPAEADIVGLARSVIGNSPDNLPVVVGASTPSSTPTTPAPTGSSDPNNPMYQSWDVWESGQIAQGLFKSDPAGGSDWGVIARQSFGPNANPARVEVLTRAIQLQSLNPDAANRYRTYVPQNVIPTLVHPT